MRFHIAAMLVGVLGAALCISTEIRAAEPRSISGVYPHLAMFNQESECGTGAVVPWADRLWAVTYAPHKPSGSTDKLYEITPDFKQIIRPESIGGTPANRFIHRESQQLFIGPYAIDAEAQVRAIPYAMMFGRHTGNARHLTEPASKIYYATMEEGLYEVDVRSLAVTRLWSDEQQRDGRHSNLPGYHGKGFYTGQLRVIYANNGEHGQRALVDPKTPSGVLATWDGQADEWTVVRRDQFTEVTGPGGLAGNAEADRDPVWSIGWDHRSLILMLLDGGSWRSYRLPKASHCYDGAHGWNTEWPRIRDIGPAGQSDLLMTMHGMFWRFPITFSAANSAGIVPRSTYLKVVGDFCRWQDRLVLGCDNTAKSEFLNKRKTKGNIAAPGQSQSNLWFIQPEQLDRLGPPLGRGAVWLDDPVKAGEASEPFLLAGFDRRGVHLSHDAPEPVTFTFEINRLGNDQWTGLYDVTIPARGYAWSELPVAEPAQWVRVRASRDCARATAQFWFSDVDRRTNEIGQSFVGLAGTTDRAVTGGLLYARGEDRRVLSVATETGYYELDQDLHLRAVQDAAAQKFVHERVAIPRGSITVDAASVLVVDDAGRRWRLPKGDAAFDAAGPLGAERVDREVCTERDLFNAHGTFYELPAENAGGFAKIRPIATHNRRIHDYCSYRGLLVLTGLTSDAPPSEHIIRSADGKAAVWVGVVDDLWQLGKPRGRGGPWRDTAVTAGVPSDPYLLTGYDQKHLRLSHASSHTVNLRLELDITGDGQWHAWRTSAVPPGQAVEVHFPSALGAYWLRTVTDRDCTASAELDYH